MAAILPAIFPVALIILIGFIANRTLALEISTLSTLTVYILSPALIADSLYRTTLSSKSTVGILIGYGITSALLYLLIWLICQIFTLAEQEEKSLFATSLFSNNGNLGLPFISFALGEAGLERAVVYMIGSSVLMYSLGPALLKGKGLIFGLNLTLKLPLFWSILLGMSLRLSGVKLPFKLDFAIQILGAAAIPIALLILGMQLAITPFSLGKQEIGASILRLVLSPALAYGVGKVMHLETLDLQVLVLQSAMPTAVSSLLLVTEFGGNPEWVARTIVISTLMSFVTLPLVLLLITI